MIRFRMFLLLTTIGMFAMGCAAARQPVTGFWFSDVKGPEAVAGGAATKTGEDCATSILGLIATEHKCCKTGRRDNGCCIR